MKVIVDDKIPYIREAIERIADEVVYLPGAQFTPEAVKDADALIIRTRTRCTRELLAGSRVRFIATATIGFDHIDTAYLREAGIAWTNCPGCNAGSVEQYIHSVFLLLKRERGVKPEATTLGVVGVGHVGSRIAAMAERMGMRVLRNDPPRAAAEGTEGFATLDELAREADILTFHTPLIRDGEYRTFHLADEAFFRSLQRKPLVINSSRGEVVDTQALLQALDSGQVGDAVIDTWENEPHINLTLLNKVYIGTPHIAGYSADGKANATRMALDALCHFFHLQANYQIEAPALDGSLVKAEDAEEASLLLYDPRRDCQALRQHPEAFESLRGNYPLRRESW
jgi:erythronate-4-phosphate dehydrogenase